MNRLYLQAGEQITQALICTARANSLNILFNQYVMVLKSFFKTYLRRFYAPAWTFTVLDALLKRTKIVRPKRPSKLGWTTHCERANVPPMIDPKLIDDLTARLAGNLPVGLQLLQGDFKKNLRASLEAGLAKLDLVTREEFDVQSAVLARTREKLERLEAQIRELEKQLG